MASRKPKGKTRAKPGTSRQAAADRRKAFVEAYLANGENGLQAAISAGFAQKSAGVTACKLLKDHRVLAELEQRREQIADKLELTTERILREVARLAFSDPRKFYKEDGTLKAVHELDDDTAAALASVEVDEIRIDGTAVGITKKYKHWDKRAALDMAMKFRGLYEKDNGQAAPQVRIVMVPAKEPA